METLLTIIPYNMSLVNYVLSYTKMFQFRLCNENLIGESVQISFAMTSLSLYKRKMKGNYNISTISKGQYSSRFAHFTEFIFYNTLAELVKCSSKTKDQVGCELRLDGRLPAYCKLYLHRIYLNVSSGAEIRGT